MAGSIFNTRIKWYFNTPQVMARLGKWRHDTLRTVGGYGLKTMRNLLSRKPLKAHADRTVTVQNVTRTIRGHTFTGPVECYVQSGGLVIDKKTNRPVDTQTANQARAMAYANLKGKGVGKPPRLGATKKLRNISDFRLDPATESVVIGIIPFPKQPAMAGTVSVPELLDVGGVEMIDALGGSVKVMYGERPFTIPTLPPTMKRMHQIIQRHPAGRRGP